MAMAWDFQKHLAVDFIYCFAEINGNGNKDGSVLNTIESSQCYLTKTDRSSEPMMTKVKNSSYPTTEHPDVLPSLESITL